MKHHVKMLIQKNPTTQVDYTKLQAFLRIGKSPKTHGSFFSSFARRLA